MENGIVVVSNRGEEYRYTKEDHINSVNKMILLDALYGDWLRWRCPFMFHLFPDPECQYAPEDYTYPEGPVRKMFPDADINKICGMCANLVGLELDCELTVYNFGHNSPCPCCELGLDDAVKAHLRLHVK